MRRVARNRRARFLASASTAEFADTGVGRHRGFGNARGSGLHHPGRAREMSNIAPNEASRDSIAFIMFRTSGLSGVSRKRCSSVAQNIPKACRGLAQIVSGRCHKSASFPGSRAPPRPPVNAVAARGPHYETAPPATVRESRSGPSSGAPARAGTRLQASRAGGSWLRSAARRSGAQAPALSTRCQRRNQRKGYG